MVEKNEHRMASRNSPPVHKRRIFYRTVLMACALVVFTAVIFLAITIPSQRAQLLEEMRRQSKVAYTSTAQVAIEAIVLEDFSTIVEHCINLVTQNPGLKYVVLTREDGFSLIHTQTLWQQSQLSGLWKPPLTDSEVMGRLLENSLSDGTVYHASYPLTYSGIHWGWIHLGLSPEKFFQDLRALYTRTIVVALVAVLGGLIIAFAYARRLSVPIQRLERFAKRIAKGDLSRRIEITTGDEVQSLADSFNHMVEALDRSNRELIKTARQAGMAEMAVDVLHNVGNVLNSVGVTTQDLKRRVQESKMASMGSVGRLLEEHNHDLPSFMATDPKGQKLPEYLVALGKHMAQDHAAMRDSLQDLERYIQHIQDIVRLQQNYSRTIGLTENVNIAEVIEDAVALNLDAIHRHDIHLTMDLAELPNVILDRQKLLQIATNLISNAKQAFKESRADDKQIAVAVSGRPADKPETVSLTVSDNGIGIEEAYLTRIFQHGFTTRRDGHGFGLHSAAIAATEMNGALHVESPGPGLGATFTLTLPYRTTEKDHDSL